MKGLWKKALLTAVVVSFASMLLLNVDASAKTTHNVAFIYGTKISMQTVADGGNAVIPTDTSVSGYTFIGWTDSALNVKADKMILGMYTNNTPYAASTSAVSNVKKINDNTTAPFLPWWSEEKGVPGKTCVVRWYNGWNNELWKTDVVPYGSSLPNPEDPCIDGLEFVGWEGSWTNVTEDRAIKAWYYRNYTVKFVNSENGEVHDIQHVRSGENAKYPTTPTMNGYSFDKWEGSIEGVHEDRTIYSIFKPN